jgi:hypothetical protein
MPKRVILGILDWIAVWLIVFIATTTSTFIVDPSQVLNIDMGTLLYRSSLFTSAVTIFYGSWTWLRRAGTTVPQEIQDKLPHNAPSTADQP